MARDLYEELGLNRDAGEDEVRKAYRKLAAKLHPDKNPGDKKVEARFKAINRAYHVLSDKEKRQLYDEFGEDGLREGFDAEAARAYRRAAGAGGGARFRRSGPGGFSVEEIFAGNGFGDVLGDLLRGGRGGAAAGGVRGAERQRAGMKGSDVASEVAVDFVSAIRGAELKLQLQDGGEEVTVRVPAGAGDGDRVRVPGHGAPGLFGGPAGDLVLTIRVKPHPFFERDGLDLYLDLPITVAEAFRGAKVRVPTPHGDVMLSIPKHAQSGQVVRLEGKGVKRKTTQGDLYVRFLVKLPDEDTPELQKAVDTLERAMTSDVRGRIRF